MKKYSLPKIRPFTKNELMNIPSARGMISFDEDNPEKTREIALGTATEKDTIATLWHEQMHDIIYTMFDFSDEAEEINQLLDKSFFYKKETGEINWSKDPISLMHDLQTFLFGEQKRENYKMLKNRESWKN